MSKKILQLISGDFEDLEVWYPVYRCSALRGGAEL